MTFGGKGPLIIEKGTDILGMLLLFRFFSNCFICELYTVFPNPTHYPVPVLTLYLCNLPPQ